MPQPVNAGSVLGGRYKVTAQVLASAENDLVLDGVDQVLNRAVSILVAAPQNASQVSASAREIAIGERHSTVQILDLGVSDGRTYLVTSNGSAADLLDLVIERDAPYVEPFFTDTLGSEIFGVARSREPETVEEDRYVEEHTPRDRKPLLSNLPKPHLPRFGRAAGATGAGAAGAAGAGAEAEAERDLEYGGPQEAPAEAATGAAVVPPPPSQSPRTAAYSAPTRDTPVQSPKVSRWEEEDAFPAEGYAAAGPGDRKASNFPRTALGADYETEEEYDGDDDQPTRGGDRKFGRVLVGGILSVILLVAVVLAFTTLGRNADIFAGDEATSPAAESPAVTENPAEATGAALPAPLTAGITRLVPGNQELDSVNDAALPQIIDGNDASYWSSYVYASDTFGGLAPSLALVVELEEESAISKVDITQLNGSGGNFSVMLNDSPSLDGATTVAQSGFTGPTTSINVPKGADGEPASASYVIINFTQLPRLSGVQAEYPWGLRIAEISVS